MKRLIRAVTVSLFAMLAACQTIPQKFGDHPEFGPFVREAKGRFLGCYGYALAAPGVDGTPAKRKPNDVFPIPGTTDFWQTAEIQAYNQRAWLFAEEYNRWLLDHRK
jgi:hypothetical protein